MSDRQSEGQCCDGCGAVVRNTWSRTTGGHRGPPSISPVLFEFELKDGRALWLCSGCQRVMLDQIAHPRHILQLDGSLTNAESDFATQHGPLPAATEEGRWYGDIVILPEDPQLPTLRARATAANQELGRLLQAKYGGRPSPVG